MVQSIVDKVVGEGNITPETIDMLEIIRCEDRPNSMLTQIAKELYLFPRVLSGEEYNLAMTNQRTFHHDTRLSMGLSALSGALW